MKALLGAGVIFANIALSGCSTETETPIGEQVPSSPGHYLLKHQLDGATYLTVAKVLQNGEVLTDKGHLPGVPGIPIPWMVTVNLEQCGPFHLRYNSGAWMGIIGDGVRKPHGCPLNTISGAAEFIVITGEEK